MKITSAILDRYEARTTQPVPLITITRDQWDYITAERPCLAAALAEQCRDRYNGIVTVELFDSPPALARLLTAALAVAPLTLRHP